MKYILWFVSFAVVFGVVLPYLISYPSDVLVIAGFVIGIIYSYSLFKFVKKELTK